MNQTDNSYVTSPHTQILHHDTLCFNSSVFIYLFLHNPILKILISGLQQGKKELRELQRQTLRSVLSKGHEIVVDFEIPGVMKEKVICIFICINWRAKHVTFIN